MRSSSRPGLEGGGERLGHPGLNAKETARIATQLATRPATQALPRCELRNGKSRGHVPL